MSPRVRALLLTIPLAVDCFFNMLHGGSIRHTLSGEAWRNRDHKWWGWTAYAIDTLWMMFGGGPHHTERAAKKEAQWGSIWAVWLAEIKGEV